MSTSSILNPPGSKFKYTWQERKRLRSLKGSNKSVQTPAITTLPISEPVVPVECINVVLPVSVPAPQQNDSVVIVDTPAQEVSVYEDCCKCGCNNNTVWRRMVDVSEEHSIQHFSFNPLCLDCYSKINN